MVGIITMVENTKKGHSSDNIAPQLNVNKMLSEKVFIEKITTDGKKFISDNESMRKL